jgi:putative SOS response-associated peptidase YedK
MCGRAILVSSVEEIASMFGVDAIPIGPPRFNVAPGQDLVIVRAKEPARVREGEPAEEPGRELAMARWGLVPWWSKDGKIAPKCIQARVETLAKAPAFRDSFKRRRCLVVVDGFYEWSGTGKSRHPHHIHRADRRPFAIAAIWDYWQSPIDGSVIQTCAVVTTAARGPIAALHDRMPLVLDDDERERWLTTSAEDAGAVASGGDRLVVVPVSTWVNDVGHDDAHCLEAPGTEPVAPAQTTLRF